MLLTLNPFMYFKRIITLIIFLLRAHPLSPFFLSIIFFHSTLSVNSLLLVLYSHILTGFLPTPVTSILHFNSEYHDYMTRSRFNLHKTSHKYQFAITWQAPIIWNNIPMTVRINLTVS